MHLFLHLDLIIILEEKTMNKLPTTAVLQKWLAYAHYQTLHSHLRKAGKTLYAILRDPTHKDNPTEKQK
jgi:hypothetical protein